MLEHVAILEEQIPKRRRGTKERAACYWSDPRQSWEISVGRWAGYVCRGKKQQKAEANINNTTVSLASHWWDGEVSFRQNHTTCLFKLVCAHNHFFKTRLRCSRGYHQPETAWHPSVTLHSFPLSKKKNACACRWHRRPISARQRCWRGNTNTGAREPESHQARGVTHNLVRPPGLSCLYTSVGSG